MVIPDIGRLAHAKCRMRHLPEPRRIPLGDIDDLLRKREAELVQQRMTTEKVRGGEMEAVTREATLTQRAEQEWLELFRLLKVTTDNESLDGKPFAFQELMGRKDCCFLQLDDARLNMVKRRQHYEPFTYNAEFQSIYHDILPFSFSLKTMLVGDDIFWAGLDTDIPQPWTTAGLAEELVSKLTALYVDSQSATR